MGSSIFSPLIRGLSWCLLPPLRARDGIRRKTYHCGNRTGSLNLIHPISLSIKSHNYYPCIFGISLLQMTETSAPLPAWTTELLLINRCSVARIFEFDNHMSRQNPLSGVFQTCVISTCMKSIEQTELEGDDGLQNWIKLVVCRGCRSTFPP